MVRIEVFRGASELPGWSTVNLVVVGNPGAEEVAAALRGESSPAGGMVIRVLAPFFPEARSIGGMAWRGGDLQNPYDRMMSDR